MKAYKNVLFKDATGRFLEFRHEDWTFLLDQDLNKLEVHFMKRPIYANILKDTVKCQDYKKTVDKFLSEVVSYLERYKV